MNARLFACIVAAMLATGAAACGGGSKSDTPLPKVTTATAVRDVTDGAALLTTTITLDFDRPFDLAPSRIPLSSNFELQVPDPRKGDNATKRVLVSKADFDKSARTITLAVGGLVADGSKLTISNKAFREGDTGSTVATIQSDLSTAAVILATVPLTTTSDIVLSDPAPLPVKPEDDDPAAQRKVLQAHLETRGSSAVVEAAALARYDAMSAQVVPSPKVRAALAALTGTFAQPALDSLFSADNCTGKPVSQILIQPPPDMPELLARVTYTADGARILSLNPSLAGDRIEHIMPFLAHETIHCDQQDSLSEEVVATAFDTFLYMQLLAADPSILQANTPAGRELNLDAIAMINSGRALPESIGILQSAGFTLALPGSSAPYPSFADLVVAAYPDVPNDQPVDEPVADAYVQVLASSAGMQPESAFNVFYMDELLGRAADPRLIGLVIDALELAPAS